MDNIEIEKEFHSTFSVVYIHVKLYETSVLVNEQGLICLYVPSGC